MLHTTLVWASSCSHQMHVNSSISYLCYAIDCTLYGLKAGQLIVKHEWFFQILLCFAHFTIRYIMAINEIVWVLGHAWQNKSNFCAIHSVGYLNLTQMTKQNISIWAHVPNQSVSIFWFLTCINDNHILYIHHFVAQNYGACYITHKEQLISLGITSSFQQT